MTISRLRYIAWIAGLLIALAATGVRAESLPTVHPEEVGLSSQRLARLDRVMQRHADENELAGVVMLIARHGKIAHFSAIGKMDLESGEEMRRDSIFRLYSMTKPITSVALLMLYEEGYFQLTDPIENYLPALKDAKVFNGLDKADEMILVDPTRKVSIQDMFRHTAGLTYGFFSDTPVDKAYREAGIGLNPLKLKDLVDKIGSVPLLYQPGTQWVYSYSHDVQAYLVECLSGMSFDVYLREKIFKPLGMEDTAFGLAQEKLDRFTTYYQSIEQKDQAVSFDPLVPGLQPIDKPKTSEYLRGADFPGGGSGLVSTAADYFRFSQMLLNGGVYNGVRLLSPKTVALMTMDHVPAEADRAQLPPGYGFGLGVAVLKDPVAQGNIGSIGQYGWFGIATTRVLIDPSEDMIMILLTQYAPMNFSLTSQFETLVYQAIIE